MKIVVMFDAYASGYEIKSELYVLKNIAGVQSVDLLDRTDGEAPRYCLILDVDDEHAVTLAQRMQSLRSQYAGHISNARQITYKVVR